MRSASSGLRHPASASCLGRHSRLAGRCPNNSSLFPPLAAVVVVAMRIISGKNILNRAMPERLRTLRHCIFTGGVVERNGICSAASYGSAALAAGILAPRGAVAQRLRGYKWRSEKSVKAIAPTGAALAFLCFDFFFRIVKGEQPLTTGCGTQHPLRALGDTRVLLAAAPTTALCFRRWRWSQLLHCGVGGVQR